MRYMAREGVVGWMVWDRQSRRPAFSGGRQLVDLKKMDADRIQAEMNGLVTCPPPGRIEMSANELALYIRAESDLTMAWPRGVDVTVHGAGTGIWQAKCYSPDPVRDAAFKLAIGKIASELHGKFALKSH
jgi:hypothetical protein